MNALDGKSTTAIDEDQLSPAVAAKEPSPAPKSAQQPSVVAWRFQEKVHPRQVAVAELAAHAADEECFVWVDVSGSGASELQTIAKELALPAAAVQAVLSARPRPRVKAYGEQILVAVEAPRFDPDSHELHAHELTFVIGRNFLVSVHKKPSRLIAQVMARESQAPTPLKLTSVLLLSVLFEELLVHYEEVTEGLEDEIEALEERALSDLSDAFLTDLLALKRYVFAVYRLARHHRPLMTAFLSPDFPLIGGSAAEPYFRDLDERLTRLLDGLETAKEVVDAAFDLYVSQISRRTNDIMKVLAIVSTVLLPWTVVLGFFGTSFSDPPVATSSTFPIMIALIVVMTVGILLLFYYFGWLGGAPAMRSSGMPKSGVAHRLQKTSGGDVPISGDQRASR